LTLTFTTEGIKNNNNVDVDVYLYLATTLVSTTRATRSWSNALMRSPAAFSLPRIPDCFVILPTRCSTTTGRSLSLSLSLIQLLTFLVCHL